MSPAEPTTPARHRGCDSLAAAERGRVFVPPEEFAGCVVVISHDRWFLDRIATHILAFEGDSKVTFFDGIARWTGGRRDAACRLDDRSRRRAVGGCALLPPTIERGVVHIATRILAFEGDSKVTFFDGTVRRCGMVARRGPQVRRPELRGLGGGCVMRGPNPARCSRYFSEYEDWRRQTLGDAATRSHRITYRKLTR